MQNKRHWLVASDEGVTIGPKDGEFENLQILGTATGDTAEDALGQFKRLDKVASSEFNEVVLYLLADPNPTRLYLEDEEENPFFTPSDFRDDLVDVTIDGYNDINGDTKLKTMSDILKHLDDEVVETEYKWSASNVIENVVNRYLSDKGLLNGVDADLSSSLHKGYTCDEYTQASALVEFKRSPHSPLPPRIGAEIKLEHSKFNDDEHIQQLIDSIVAQVEQQLKGVSVV